MRRIRLQSAEGGLVGHAEIPPFQDGNLPSVVIFEERTFRLERVVGALPVYAECFAVVLTGLLPA